LEEYYLSLLVEKYRPQVIEDVAGFIPTFDIDEDMPHLLLYGPPGTGKTTLARIIIKMLDADSITLNASSERGIETVRQKITEFAGTKSSNEGIKIVFLDEADHLTQEAQTALRNIMETHCRNTRFIMTCNYFSKIIDPIKSRCLSIKFDNIPIDIIIARMKFICDNEKIPYEVEALQKIVERTGSDMRSAINKLESMKDGVFLSKIVNETKLAQTVFDKIKSKNFNEARQLYLDSVPDNEQFLKDIYKIIFDSSETQEYKLNALLKIRDAYIGLPAGSWPQIVVETMILELIQLRG